MARPIVLCWSGGKDSALALDALLHNAEWEVVSLLTTVTRDFDRISMHGVRRALLAAQVAALGLPLAEAEISPGATNEQYESEMARVLTSFREQGVRTVAFGDLFLADIRAYRERQISALGMKCVFPVWGLDTTDLAHRFVRDGFRAITCCVDPRQLDQSFCGRELDEAFLRDLPAGVDRCGENGEFHTFVYDGPNFSTPIDIDRGEVVNRDGFWYCDIMQRTRAAVIS